MNKKIENAIRDSFNFPESQHKEDFFRQVGGSCNDKRKKTVPVIYRISAAAAAIAAGVGIFGALKIQTGANVNDIVDNTSAVTTSVSDNRTTQPAVTTNSVTAQNANVTTSLSEVTSVGITLSAAETAHDHSDTASHSQYNDTAKNITTSIVTADVSTLTNNGVSAPDISSITTSPPASTKPHDERSFSMKKISAFAASLVTASHTSSIPGSAVNDLSGFLEQKHNEYFSGEPSSNTEKMEWLHRNERILDLNSDGKYDIFDVYAYYRSFMTYISEKDAAAQIPDSIMKNYEKYGDLDLDGVLGGDHDDLFLATDYFFTYYTLEPEYFSPCCYYCSCPDKYTDNGDTNVSESDSYAADFISILSDRSMRAYRSYSLFFDLIDDGTLITDTNGDGKYTIEDLYDLITYYELQRSGSADTSSFTAKEWEKLKANDAQASLYFSTNGLYLDYYCTYFFERNAFEYCYADKMFYSDMRNGIGADDIVRYVKEYMHYYSPDVYDPRYNFTKDDISEQFTEYYRNVKNGLLPEPDIDMNGRIDFEDYIYADLMLNLSYAESVLSPDAIDQDIKKNFYQNCDFNNNRMSGDLADTVCVELYVVKELGIQEDEVVNEIARYYKAHPEIDVYDYAHYVLPEEIAAADAIADDGDQNASSGIRSIKQFVSKIAIFKPRSGDANCDGIVDMSDVITIIQYIAYPDRYTLTKEGLYNADICYTGDGITILDAFMIEKKIIESL